MILYDQEFGNRGKEELLFNKKKNPGRTMCLHQLGGGWGGGLYSWNQAV